MRVLRYDWHDIIHAASLGLRVRKWVVAFPGVVLAFLWWTIFGYMALVSHGLPLSRIWMGFGPVPWPTLSTLGTGITPVLWLIADLGFWIAMLLTCTALSRITFEQLRGNDFTTWTEAWAFSLRRWKPIIVSPIVFFIGAGAAVISVFVFSLLIDVWSPLAGFLFIATLPIIIGGLYLCLVALLGIIYGPSIVATSNSLTLETLFETLSLNSSQGRRGWLYATLSAGISGVYTASLGFFLGVASLLTTWILDFGHDGIAGTLLKRGMIWAPRIWGEINGVPGIIDAALRAAGRHATASFSFAALSEPLSTGVVIMVIWLVLFFFLLIAQFLTTMSSCCTTGYIVLRQHKDEQNLLEEDLGED